MSAGISCSPMIAQNNVYGLSKVQYKAVGEGVVEVYADRSRLATS